MVLPYRFKSAGEGLRDARLLQVLGDGDELHVPGISAGLASGLLHVVADLGDVLSNAHGKAPLFCRYQGTGVGRGVGVGTGVGAGLKAGVGVAAGSSSSSS